MHAATKTALAAAVIVAFLAAGAGYHQATEDTMTCTITHKERVYGKDREVRGRQIHTSECGILAVADVPLRNEWDALDLYRSIETGVTYDLTTTGARVPALGWNPTVIAAEESMTSNSNVRG